MAAAQSKTDFSGTWNVDAAKSDPAPRGGGGAGATTRLVITQTAANMTVIVTTGRGDVKTTYKLDGTEMKESAAISELCRTLEPQATIARNVANHPKRELQLCAF